MRKLPRRRDFGPAPSAPTIPVAAPTNEVAGVMLTPDNLGSGSREEDDATAAYDAMVDANDPDPMGDFGPEDPPPPRPRPRLPRRLPIRQEREEEVEDNLDEQFPPPAVRQTAPAPRLIAAGGPPPATKEPDLSELLRAVGSLPAVKLARKVGSWVGRTAAVLAAVYLTLVVYFLVAETTEMSTKPGGKVTAIVITTILVGGLMGLGAILLPPIARKCGRALRATPQ